MNKKEFKEKANKTIDEVAEQLNQLKKKRISARKCKS
jgi:frataxin-like iron-binding protein CyaY